MYNFLKNLSVISLFVFIVYDLWIAGKPIFKGDKSFFSGHFGFIVIYGIIFIAFASTIQDQFTLLIKIFDRYGLGIFGYFLTIGVFALGYNWAKNKMAKDRKIKIKNNDAMKVFLHYVIYSSGGFYALMLFSFFVLILFDKILKLK